MNETKTSEELKMLAKGQLLGHYGKMICAFWVITLIGSVILLFAERLLPASAPYSRILYFIIELLVLLLLGIFTLGHTKLYMNFVAGRPAQINDIFYGFRGHADIGIKIMLVQCGISFACLIPYAILSAVYTYIKSAYVLPFVSIALIAGVIYAMTWFLSFSQCYYIAIDFPDYELKQILSMSRRVMKGQRARLFYLYVSFIPLGLLSILSFGLGLLWLYPYMQCTLTHFYLDLMDYHARQYA